MISNIDPPNPPVEDGPCVHVNRAYFIKDIEESIRVLAVMPDEDIALTIKLHGRSARIREDSLTRLNTMLQYRKLVPVQEEPFLLAESTLTGAKKEKFQRIKPALIELTSEGIRSLWQKTLWKSLKVAGEKIGRSADTMNTALTRVMQAGGCLIAAVARYKYVPPKAGTREGSYELSEQEKDRIATGVREFLRGATTWQEAWEAFLKKHYAKGMRVKSGVQIPILREPGDRPSKDQFIYYGTKRVPLVERLILRFGEEGYLRNHRGKPNGHSRGALYPGVRADVDWTITDIVCVTRNGRMSVGRLVLFLVIDRFSGMVMSAYLTMHTGSYREAGRAILGCLEDKSALFKKYGLTLDPGEWDVSELPIEITVDKGELASWKATPIVSALGIRIEITPARRPDLKGTVESFFAVLRFCLRRLRGATSGIKERQTEHPNVTAIYDFDEVYALILSLVVKFNARIRRRQARTSGMVRHKVLSVPNKIWAHGKKLGCLRQFPLEAARVGVLPAHFASVTEAGIQIKGLRYVVPDFNVDEPGGIEANEWLTKARKNRWEVEVGIDEASVDFVWLRHRPPGRPPVVLQCPLNGEFPGYQGLSWTEYGLQRKEITALLKDYRERELMDIRGVFRARLDRITTAAERKTDAARVGMKTKQITAGAPDQRAAEAATDTTNTPAASAETGAAPATFTPAFSKAWDPLDSESQ